MAKRLVRLWRIGFFAIIATSLVVTFNVLQSSSSKNTTLLKPPSKDISYAENLSSTGLTIDSSYSLTPDGDRDSNGVINAGDTVRFIFTVTNKSNQAARFNNLETGIPSKFAINTHNEQGFTGYVQNKETVTLANVVILPGQTQILKFDAQMPVSDRQFDLPLEPKLISNSGAVIVKSEAKTIQVAESNGSIGSSNITDAR